MTSHDQHFKNLIGDYLLQSLKMMLPDLTASWPADVRIVPIRQEQLKARMGDTFRELDIPVAVEFPDQSRKALVIVIEIESKDREEFLYYLSIVCTHVAMLLKTRRIIPVAFYPFRSAPLAESFTLGDDDTDYQVFRCRSCVLGTMQARDYESSKNLVARLCLPLMKHDPAEKLLMVTRAYEALAEFEPDAGKRIKYAEFVGLYADLSKDEETEFREIYVDQSPYRENIMTLTEIWEERGEVRGEARGEVRGRAIGQVEVIMGMYADGELSAESARARLSKLLLKDAVPKELIENALKKIPN